MNEQCLLELCCHLAKGTLQERKAVIAEVTLLIRAPKLDESAVMAQPVVLCLCFCRLPIPWRVCNRIVTVGNIDRLHRCPITVV